MMRNPMFIHLEWFSGYFLKILKIVFLKMEKNQGISHWKNPPSWSIPMQIKGIVGFDQSNEETSIPIP